MASDVGGMGGRKVRMDMGKMLDSHSAYQSGNLSLGFFRWLEPGLPSSNQYLLILLCQMLFQVFGKEQ